MGLDLQTIGAWGTKLITAERALMATTPKTSAATKAMGDVATEAAKLSDSLGSDFYNRGTSNALRGVSELLSTTASGLGPKASASDADSAVWVLRDVGDTLRGFAQRLQADNTGGAASLGGAASIS
jgi:hypothetical protein